MKVLMVSPYISEVYGEISKIVKETIKVLGDLIECYILQKRYPKPILYQLQSLR